MKIVVEGIDGTGKTYLAHELSNMYLYDYIHSVLPHTKQELIQDMAKDYVIFDRAWISEIVYAKAFGREPLITLSEINKFNLYRKSTIYVLLYSPIPPNFHKVEPEILGKYDEINKEYLYIMDRLIESKVFIYNPLKFKYPQEMAWKVFKDTYFWANRKA
jgi:thymidylate kinase